MQHRPATLIQISDCHLFAEPERELGGVNTYRSLIDVLDLIRQQEPQIDHLILTGDISQDDSIESYHVCHQLLADLNVPFTWLRGNHDDMSTAASVMYQSNFQRIVAVGNWKVVMLNSQVSKQIHGELDANELAALEEALIRFQVHPTLLAIHHPPATVDSQWLDQINLKNSNSLITLLKGYPQVQGIIHGHIHQERDIIEQGIRILSAPSTCVQFAPNAEQFNLDTRQPGYRSLTLYPDGHMQTKVHRLPKGTWLPDTSQSAY